MTVNGKSWPFFEVQPRRYRFRVVNASNARFIQAQLMRSERNHQPTTTPGPHIWQIGSDGGFLTGSPVPPGAEEGGWKDTIKIARSWRRSIATA